MDFVRGNSIGMTLSESDRTELERIFEELSNGGQVLMPLQKTFWSELYGMTTDKYGILWHMNLTKE